MEEISSKKNKLDSIRISSNYCYKILKLAGAKQVSPEAVEHLRKILETIALDISKRSIDFAYDGSRQKVSDTDVKNAVEQFEESLVSRVRERWIRLYGWDGSA